MVRANIAKVMQASKLLNGNKMAPFRSGAYIAVVAAILVALCSSSANAIQPPWKGCRAASKIEYDSAGRQYLLNNRFGMYVRTGGVWRRQYWYCPN
jgi:hypothetical protein